MRPWTLARIRRPLFEVAATDPMSWAVAFTLLGVVLLLAVTPPAVRAAHVDPIVALQADE